MQLAEYDRNLDIRSFLPGLRLPNNKSNNSSKNSTINGDSTILEIRDLLKDMKKNKNRTTNFSIILYLDENNYEKISIDVIKSRIKKDFSLNPEMFINSTTKCPFESEKNVIQSLNSSISRNKSFKTEIVNKTKFVTLNKQKTLEYLRKMYKKYTNKNIYNNNNDNDNNYDITSLTSVDSKKSKFGNTSEKKKLSMFLLGNKTCRNNSNINNEGQINENEEENIYSNYKFLYDNLQDSEKNSDKKSIKKKDKEKNENIFDKNFKFSEISPENSKNPLLSVQEIDKSINNLNESENLIKLYKEKFLEIKLRLEEKEKKYKDYQEAKLNLDSKKKELNVLFEILSIKLGIIQSTKKNKYYGTTFEKSKKSVLNYKNLFEQKINSLQQNLDGIKTIENDIMNKYEEISKLIKKIQVNNDLNKGNSYIAKNEIKKDVSNLMKKIKNENRTIEELNDNNNIEDNSHNSNNDLVDEIKKKFNDIIEEINLEKEELI